MLTDERAEKLQIILSKRFGRPLDDSELESAYKALVGFAVALIDLVDDERIVSNEHHSYKLPIAMS